jgi:hypothetical protein
MTYEVGTRIDLTHLNQKDEVEPAMLRRSFKEAVANSYDVGTQVSFKLIGNKFTTVRHIPVIAM